MGLTEEQEKELDEMAKKFSETIGDGSQGRTSSAGDVKDTKGGK